MSELCEIRKRMTSCLKSQIDSGLENLNAEEAGAAADIIKDLAEAEYYETVTKAMQKGEKFHYGEDNSEVMDRMGYRPNVMRKPYVDQEPYIDEYLNERMGYVPTMSEGGHNYGKGYSHYRSAKRHYTETKSPQDKERMTTSIQEHLNDTMFTFREMMKDADPNLKQKMKAELTALVNEI